MGILFIGMYLADRNLVCYAGTVKLFAKLVLFFSLSFMAILFLAALLDFLQEWTNQAVLFPPPGGSLLSGNFLTHLEKALPAAFYVSILLGLTYSIRQRIAYPAAFAVLLVLSLALSAAAFMGLKSLEQGEVPITLKKAGNLAQPGFILTQGPIPEIADRVVFLEDPYKAGGTRAVSRRGQSLYYQGSGSPLSPARLPFTEEKSRLLGNIAADFQRSGRFLSAWFEAGLLPYAVYAGSLAVLLLSLGCLVNISFWSLANLFFGALAFRGALALESFLNQQDIHGLLTDFAGKFIPPSMESLINPIIFSTLGALILLYSALVYLARGRRANG